MATKISLRTERRTGTPNQPPQGCSLPPTIAATLERRRRANPDGKCPIIHFQTDCPTGKAGKPIAHGIFPLGEGIFPLGDSISPLDDATFPLDDATFPLGDVTFPLGDATFPLGDATFPLDDVTFPLGEIRFP